MNADEVSQASDAILSMYLASKGREPSEAEVDAYMQVIAELSFDEFTAGILRARKKKGSGFTVTDGEIYQEAMAARREMQRHAREEYERSKALPAVVEAKWPDRVPNTIAEQVVAYEQAAEMAKANHNQALKEWQRTPPGDPALEDIMERRIKYRANYWHFLKLRDQYQEMLDHGETESTIATEAKALERRAKQAREQWEGR
jgi:hypothetical protein